MANAKLWWGLAGAACVALAVGTNLTDPKPPNDDCALTEAQVRQLWVGTLIHSHDDAERTRMTQSLVHAFEAVCRDSGQARVVPLPPEIQGLVRK